MGEACRKWSKTLLLESMSKPETRPLSRYERRRRETRGRILAAAGELFGQQGVEKTTVLDICERADVAQQNESKGE